MQKYFKQIRNPFILFLPFLLYYITFVLRLHSDEMIGDESRYYMYAHNLLQGFYSPPPPDIYLWNGPGYPLFLMPFVFFKTPLIAITLTNALLQYLSVVFLFKSIIKVTNFRKALFFSIFWALSFEAYYNMSLILTESFTYFLISLFMYLVLQAFKDNKKRFLYYAGFILGFIALTKIIFGYVILVMLLINFLLWILKPKKQAYKSSLVIFFISLLTITPYILYTYNLTRKIYYLGNSGGMSLYWMSTPYENEYGDWNIDNFFGNNPNISLTDRNIFLRKHHQDDMDIILKNKSVKRDDAYKRIALKNIKNHPKKYLRNIYFNISRMFFNFPNTYSFQKPSRVVWYSSILFTLIIFSLILSIINWKSIDYTIKILLVTVFVYLSGTSLLSAYFRQFSVAIPILLLWIAYIIDKTVYIKFKF